MIFINYRNEDTNAVVTHLYHRLVEHFGEEPVFVDFNDITPGEKWPDTLQEKLQESSVLLAVIGSEWGNARFAAGKEQGRLRLDDPDDWVRQEICTAIGRGSEMRVIVVLVDDARLPETEWKCDLDHLAKLQHAYIRNGRDFERDFSLLCAALEMQIPQLHQAAELRRPVKSQLLAGAASPSLRLVHDSGQSPRYQQFLRDLECSIEQWGLQDSDVARIVRVTLSDERELEPAVGRDLSWITAGIRASDYYFGLVSASAGQQDWQQDFSQITTPMLVGVARSLERSFDAQAVVIRLCEAIADRLGLNLIWPENPIELNDLTNAIYRACRDAKSLDSDDVLILLNRLTVVSRN